MTRANVLIFKIRKFVEDEILRSIYFAIFESNLNHCSIVWAQNLQPRNSHTSLLFRKTSILKLVHNPINNLLPSLFNYWFIFSSDTHKCYTSWFSNRKLQKYSPNINICGRPPNTCIALKQSNLLPPNTSV